MSESDHAMAMPEPTAGASLKPSGGNAVWREIKGFFWLALAVLSFHSFIAKPFYIPSESMMPILLKGDRLVVSKYPYGWSWVSVSFHLLPEMPGRIFGKLPSRGDIVILSPPGRKEDYIKRVIALPGDRIEISGGQIILNGRPVPRVERPAAMIPVDANTPCAGDGFDGALVTQGGRDFCRLPVYRETLPGGRSYDTIDTGETSGDYRAPIVVPAGRIFVMGDNRDNSSDSRFPLDAPYNGLGGPVPWENIGGRAELITFSFDGTGAWYNPLSWFTALRGGRAGTSLHPDEQ